MSSSWAQMDQGNDEFLFCKSMLSGCNIRILYVSIYLAPQIEPNVEERLMEHQGCIL